MKELSYNQIFLMWFDIILINFCGAFFIKYNLDGFLNNTFVLIWLTPLFIILFKYYKKRSVNLDIFLVGSAVILVAIVMSIFFKSKYDNNVFVKTNYKGIVSRKSDEMESYGRNDEYVGYTSFLEQHSLYHENSNINKLIKKLEEENDMVGSEKFIFWQSGLIKGYTLESLQINKESYDGYFNYFIKIIPFFILETLLNSLLIFILSIILIIIWHIFYQKRMYRQNKTLKELLVPITFDIYTRNRELMRNK